MRHLCGYRKLGKKSAHRKAMFRNMATSFFLHERINTTLPKAKELRGIVEKMITLGKRGDLHARRLAASYLYDDEAVKKVFSSLAERFKDRPGGYTRILRLGTRFGDGAKLAIIELLDAEIKKAPKKEKEEKKESTKAVAHKEKKEKEPKAAKVEAKAEVKAAAKESKAKTKEIASKTK